MYFSSVCAIILWYEIWGGVITGVIETLLITTFLAGVVGTGLGGLVGAMLQKNSNRAVSLLLSFAAGAMLYVVVEELVPQAHSRAGTCGFVGGFLIMMVLDVALG